MKHCFLFLSMFLLLECSPKSPLITYSLEELEYENYRDIRYLIVKKLGSQIDNCLENNEAIRNDIYTKNSKEIILFSEAASSDPNSRAIIQSRNPIASIPTKYLDRNIDFAVHMCVNPLGMVVMTRLDKTNVVFDKEETTKILSHVHGYRLEEKTDASCLECGLLKIDYKPVR